MFKEINIQHFKGLSGVTLEGLRAINLLCGKNNSGKSSVLHAIDMAGLADSKRTWSTFPLKLEIAQLFSEAGPFQISLISDDGSTLLVESNGDNPVISRTGGDEPALTTVLILPDHEMGLLRRRHHTPNQVLSYLDDRRFQEINGLDMLMALKYYSERGERGYTPDQYEDLLKTVWRFFPELESLESDRTDQDVATVTYEEYGRKLDVLYSGTGVKHLLDISVKIALSKASVVLIDEPEMGLHPDLQRRFVDLMTTMSEESGIQFFCATHSPVLLSHAESAVFRLTNRRGDRRVSSVDRDSLYTVWADIGLRPSDLLQNDIILLVEGPKDVVVFDHIVNGLYKDDLRDVSVGVILYGGSNAEVIIRGSIGVDNVAAVNGYTIWIRDSDSALGELPSVNARKFEKALHEAHQDCHVLSQREIEWYLPECLYTQAQEGDDDKVAAVKSALGGTQNSKFAHLSDESGFAVPSGNHLKRLLSVHLTRDNLHPELKEIIENKVLRWRDEILGT